MDEEEWEAAEAALAHQQELEARWQEELEADSGYLEWLATIAASAAHEQERTHGDHC